MYASISHDNIVGGAMGAKYGTDPIAFFVAFVNQNRAKVVDLINRCAQSTGITKWKVPDGLTDGGQYTIDMVASYGDSDALLALKFVSWLMKEPKVVMDEAKRVSFGLPFRAFDEMPLDEPEPKGDGTDNEMWNAINTGLEQAGNVFTSLAAAVTGERPQGGGSGHIADRESSSDNMLPWLILGGIGIFLVARNVK